MNLKKNLLILLIIGLLSASCASNFEKVLTSSDDELKYKTALELFDQGKYTKASQLFELLRLPSKGTEREDTVHFYHGYSNYLGGDLQTAEVILNEFTSIFPISPFTEKARFLVIEALYESSLRHELDQSASYQTIRAIEEYIHDYPDNGNVSKCRSILRDLQDRLDRKSFESAKLYYTIEDYISAKVALKDVLKDNPDNKYREDIMYLILSSNYKYAENSVESKKRERYLAVIDEYYNFISEFPKSKYSKSVEEMFNESKKYTNTDKNSEQTQ